MVYWGYWGAGVPAEKGADEAASSASQSCVRYIQPRIVLAKGLLTLGKWGC